MLKDAITVFVVAKSEKGEIMIAWTKKVSIGDPDMAELATLLCTTQLVGRSHLKKS